MRAKMSFNLVLTDEAFYDRWSLLFFLDCGFFIYNEFVAPL